MKVGVVGLGWAGQQHIDAYGELDGVELIGIAGLEDDMRAQLVAEHGVPNDFARWEDLLELEGLEAISIAVPTFLHAPIAVAALERGLHVLSEKPIALNGEQAERDGRAPRAAPAGCSTSPSTTVAAATSSGCGSEIDAGRLGRPYYAKAWWLRRTGIPTLGSWFTRAELAGGGPLVDIGVHVLDYALFLLGNPGVRTVSASTYDLLGLERLRRQRRPPPRRAPATAWSASTSRTSRPSSCASTTAARCCWRPAGPPTAPTATSSGRRCTAPRAGPSGSSTTTPRSAR